MLKQKLKNMVRIKRMPGAVIVGGLLVLSVIYGGFVYADQFDRQIQQLQQESAASQRAADQFELQANSYQDAVDKLQVQIDGVTQAILNSQRQSEEVQRQLNEAQAELEEQKKVLGENIRTMYLEGEISTLEILAASRNLNEFVDRQQYRYAVQDKVKASVDKINELKVQLQKKQRQLQALIKERQNQRAQLNAAQNEQSHLLAYTAGQQAEYDAQVKKANSRINDLRRQQALENIRRFGGGDGVIGGGGYPWGNARCLGTGQVSGWCPGYEWGYNGEWRNWNTGGYAYRNCTDWVSYRVRASGGFVPGGLGNANSWDDRAPSYGFTVSSTPKVGAAAVSNSGFYGHVMYVEAVNDNGSIVVSDYNRAGTGKYDMNTINPAGLRFVYF
jgi:peptidoglycan hydrolase CwlO-like protein